MTNCDCGEVDLTEPEGYECLEVVNASGTHTKRECTSSARRCACGRFPEADGYWFPGLVLTRRDGTHTASKCTLDQVVTADRPEQDVLLAEVERLTAAIQRVEVLAQNALLANDAGMGYPVVAADDLLHALDGVA